MLMFRYIDIPLARQSGGRSQAGEASRKHPRSDVCPSFGLWIGPADEFAPADAAHVLKSPKPVRGRLSLSETHTRIYWWCSPPKIGTGSIRPTVCATRGISASLCSDKCVRASLQRILQLDHDRRRNKSQN